MRGMLSRAVLSSTLPATSRQVLHFFVFGFFTGLDAGHVAQPSAMVSTGTHRDPSHHAPGSGGFRAAQGVGSAQETHTRAFLVEQ